MNRATHTVARTTYTRTFTPEYQKPAFSRDIEQTPEPFETLLDILRRPRWADSEGEWQVIEGHIATLPGVQMDAAGNLWVEIPLADGSESTTLFTAHTDTVHTSQETGTYRLTEADGWLYRKKGGVLGADDGTGVWLLLNLIRAGVPGLYAFFREEECGGIGSNHAALAQATRLERFKRCISFDRKGYDHIITHQAGGRCCSDAFADALAEQLNSRHKRFDFAGNDGGSFTDSANFTHLIPECTNLSVGYFDQHTERECQDLSFVTALANVLIQIDWEALPVERDPQAEDEDDRYSYYGSYSSYGFRDTYVDPRPRRPGNALRPTSSTRSFHDLVDLVEDYPAEVADILEQMGWDYQALQDELIATYNCGDDS